MAETDSIPVIQGSFNFKDGRENQLKQKMQTDYQVYPVEYFSGADVTVYFNNILVDEIVSLQFRITEMKMPIYGYADYVWAAVAHGARMVDGQFSINYKEPFFIQGVLQKLQAQETRTSRSIVANLKAEEQYETIDALMEALRNTTSLADVKAIAEARKKQLWNLSGSEVGIDRSGSPFMVDLYDDKLGYNRLLKTGFDIIIAFGDQMSEMQRNTDRTGTWKSEGPSSLRIVNQVHITGVQTEVSPTGEPILETYSFIARDIDNTPL